MSAFITLDIYRAMIHGDASRWAGANVAALYRVASENGVLDEGDALLIGDLQALSKCAGLGDADLPFHALMVVLFDALNEGSLCVRCDEKHLRERLNALGLQEKLAKEIVRSLPLWRGLIGTESDYKPLILRIGEFGKLLYFQRLYASERRLEGRLKEMLSGPLCELDGAAARAVLKDVLEINPAGGTTNPIRLNTGQLAALAVCLANEFSIVSGGPGTGKTTLIATVLRCLVRLGVRAEEIHLAAPAGRAAARMTESLRRALKDVAPNAADGSLNEIEARTIHRTLGYRPTRNDFLFGANNPLEGKALVIDEASMIDATLMARLLEAAPAGMRVILVGDREQLPSVDAGAVLSDLLPSAFENGAPEGLARVVKTLVGLDLPAPARPFPAHGRAVLLSVQQRAAKPLHPYIAAVREGNGAALLNAPESDALKWLDTAGLKPDRWREFLRNWARRGAAEWHAAVKQARETLDFEQPFNDSTRTLFEQVFVLQRRSRILTFVRGGEWGSGTINALLALHLREELDPRGPREYFAGLPVLMTRNNYARRLFNGDTGMVLRDRQGRYRAVFESGGEWVFAPLDALAGTWEPGFALTVHKSQGSEFEEILLCVPPMRAKDAGERAQRMLSREVLYTGITRARKSVTLCGPRDAIEMALKRRVERVSGIVLGMQELVPEPGLLF